MKEHVLFRGILGGVLLCIILWAYAPSSLNAVVSAAPASESRQLLDDPGEVEEVVRALFDAMRARDGQKVGALFVEGAILQSAGERDGEPRLSKLPAAKFAEAVTNAEGDMWDEKIWNLNIQVDNRLASAWMDYAFFLGEKFSHCGVNSMQLFKGEDGWKIIYLADTRRQEPCEIPKSLDPGVN